MTHSSENLNQIDDILSTFQTQIESKCDNLSREMEAISELYENGCLTDDTSLPSPIIHSNNQRRTRLSSNLYKETLKNNLFKSLNDEDLNFNRHNTTIESQVLNDSNLSETLIENNNQSTPVLTNINKSADLIGFRTARGADIRINSRSLKKAENLLNLVVNDPTKAQETNEFIGFQTAKGNKITISHKAIEKAQTLIEREDLVTKSIDFSTAKCKRTEIKDESQEKVQKLVENKIPCIGFSTARGNKITINQEAIEKAKKILNNCDKEVETKALDLFVNNSELIKQEPSEKAYGEFDSDNTFVGFSTAKGNKIKISHTAIKRAQNLMVQENNVPKIFDYSTANDKRIEIKEESYDSAQKLLKDNQLSVEFPKTKDFKRVPQSLESGRENNEQIVKKSLDRSFKVPMTKTKNRSSLDSRHFKKPKVIDGSLATTNFYIVDKKNEPNANPQVVKSESLQIETEKISDTIKVQEFQSHTNIQKISAANFMMISNIPLLKVSSFVDLNTNESGPHLLRPIFRSTSIRSFTESYKKMREYHLIEMKNRLQSGHKRDLKSNGHLFNAKSSNKIKIQLKDLKLNRESIHSNSLNVDNYRFNVFDYYSSDYLNREGCIECVDGGVLVPDDQGFIGSDEFYNCFLDSNGVNCKLITRDWFNNHLKQVLLKLYSYQAKFSTSFSTNIFTPEEIVNHMKYRYDVEINNFKRSCLRKIIERDDTSINKTIVLYVLNIKSEESKIFLELSDGWYSLKALCDNHLVKYVQNKKIKKGDKLALFSAELIGPKSGFSPLEVPDDLFIKLSVNSCRKAKWYAKLGYNRVHLSIALNSIKANSNVGCISVIVERVYPLLYHEKLPDGSSITRTERQEEIFREKHANNQNRQLEKFIHSMNQTNFENKSEIDEAIAKKMKTSVEFCRRQVTPILKLRLTGTHSNDIKSKFSCSLTIWHNAVDFQESLKEGSMYRILNLSVNIPKTKYETDSSIILNTSTQTRFIPINETQEEIYFQKRKFANFSGLYTSQIESFYNEIDTCGIILQISTNNYNDLVYLYNGESSHSIVCICFTKDTDMFGFKDLFKIRETVACINLKFTLKKDNNRYPSLLASNQSIFTQKISKYEYLLDAFNQLQAHTKKDEQKEVMAILIDELSSFTTPISNNKNNNKTTLLNRIQPYDLTQNEISPLVHTKNTVRKPGLYAPPKSLTSMATPTSTRIKNIYMTKTVKRLSEESSVTIDYDNDTSFSTQELKDISLLNDSLAKRPKY